MNRYDEALERIKKSVEIQEGWAEEGFDHYNTIVFALEIASGLCEAYSALETYKNAAKCKEYQYDSCGKGKLKGGEG